MNAHRYPPNATPEERAEIDREWNESAPVSPELRARRCIMLVKRAALELADAINAVTELEDRRALVKGEAIRRLMESGAYTSATSAEKYVEADAIYSAHRATQRYAEVEKHRAIAAFEAAKLSARLEITLIETTNGMRITE